MDQSLPPVPLTIEGSSILHQMMRLRRPAWRALADKERDEIVCEASTALGSLESGPTALFSLLGHKGDLMLVHFRPGFDELGQAEQTIARLRLSDYLEP